MDEIRNAIVSAIALLRVLKGVRIDSGNEQDDEEIQAVVLKTELDLSAALEQLERLKRAPQN